MKTAADTAYWQERTPMGPELQISVWAGPDGYTWETHDTKDLLDATPPGMAVALWNYRRAPSERELSRVDRLKRSFSDYSFYKATVYSQDIHFQNHLVWFDFAVLSTKCIDSLTSLLQSQFGYHSGMLLFDQTSDPASIGGRISTILEDVWTRIAKTDVDLIDRQRWLDAERARLIREVPGHLLAFFDSNTTRYLLGWTPPTLAWLAAAGPSPLDINHVWHIGVDVLDPGLPF